jgi:hypothetical protein
LCSLTVRTLAAWRNKTKSFWRWWFLFVPCRGRLYNEDALRLRG